MEARARRSPTWATLRRPTSQGEVLGGSTEVGSPGRRSVLWLLEARGGRHRVRSPIPERRAMRGLLVSDLHYALRQFDWVQAAARRFDLVVVAGDSLDISSYVAVEAQIVVVSKYLRRMAEHTRLIASSGNHDLNA